MCVLVVAAIGGMSSPQTCDARDLRADLRSAIGATHPRVAFHITEQWLDRAQPPMLVARFKVRTKGSFQRIGLLSDFAAGPCAKDTPAEELNPEIIGFGPGGGGSVLRFCAGGRAFRLVESNSLSKRDVGHGVSLDRLASAIQKALRDLGR